MHRSSVRISNFSRVSVFHRTALIDLSRISFGLSSKYALVFLIPSAVLDTTSIKPVNGLTARPEKPYPIPIMNP